MGLFTVFVLCCSAVCVGDVIVDAIGLVVVDAYHFGFEGRIATNYFLHTVSVGAIRTRDFHVGFYRVSDSNFAVVDAGLGFRFVVFDGSFRTIGLDLLECAIGFFRALDGFDLSEEGVTIEIDAIDYLGEGFAGALRIIIGFVRHAFDNLHGEGAVVHIAKDLNRAFGVYHGAIDGHLAYYVIFYTIGARAEERALGDETGEELEFIRIVLNRRQRTIYVGSLYRSLFLVGCGLVLLNYYPQFLAMSLMSTPRFQALRGFDFSPIFSWQLGCPWCAALLYTSSS